MSLSGAPRRFKNHPRPSSTLEITNSSKTHVALEIPSSTCDNSQNQSNVVTTNGMSPTRVKSSSTKTSPTMIRRPISCPPINVDFSVTNGEESESPKKPKESYHFPPKTATKGMIPKQTWSKMKSTDTACTAGALRLVPLQLDRHDSFFGVKGSSNVGLRSDTEFDNEVHSSYQLRGTSMLQKSPSLIQKSGLQVLDALSDDKLDYSTHSGDINNDGASTSSDGLYVIIRTNQGSGQISSLFPNSGPDVRDDSQEQLNEVTASSQDAMEYRRKSGERFQNSYLSLVGEDSLFPEESSPPFQAHKRILGWKLTTKSRRKEIINMMESSSLTISDMFPNGMTGMFSPSQASRLIKSAKPAEECRRRQVESWERSVR